MGSFQLYIVWLLIGGSYTYRVLGPELSLSRLKANGSCIGGSDVQSRGGPATAVDTALLTMSSI